MQKNKNKTLSTSLLNTFDLHPIEAIRRRHFLYLDLLGAYSSAGEHFVDIEGVTGSIPVTPTKPAQLGKIKLAHRFCDVRKRRRPMKVKSSLRSLKARHRDCRVVRRKGRVYVINKTQPRFKARQG